MSASSGEHTLRTICLDRFLDHIKDGIGANQGYCFILGAGASKESGIPTGRDLIGEWRKYLASKSPAYLLEIMNELGIKSDRYDYFFNADYKINSVDYFDFFDMRFAGQPAAAYKELQSKMNGAEASFGYYALATLLSEKETGIKIVITTNFDSLIEDSLFICRSRHPLIVGHESLASYINAPENSDRPVVAKVHRDLYYQPFNHKKELDKLAANWEDPLKDILSKYIPIVIGYAGGDQTLMSLLEKIDLPGVYWCSYDGYVDDKVKKLLSADGRYVVKMDGNGFDGVMYKLVKKLLPEFDFESITSDIESTAKNRSGQFEKQLSTYAKRPDSSESDAPKPVEHSKSASTQKDPAPAGADHAAISAQQSGTVDNDTQEIPASFDGQSDANLTLADKDAYNSGKYALSLAICTELIKRDPQNSIYYNNRGITLHAMKRYDDALKDKAKAIELDPDNARYHNSMAKTLHAMEQYDKALEERNKAIELDPENAEYYNNRGVTLAEMKRYNEAIENYSKAIDIDPDDALRYSNRGVALHAVKRYYDAIKDKTKAIELHPNDAEFYRSRGITLQVMKRYDDALKDKTKAIELDPDNADYYNSRGITFHLMKRYDDALKNKTKAIELDPDNADYYNSRGITFHSMKRFDDAIKDKIKAIELDPNNADYYDNRGATMYAMSRFNDALVDETHAIELDPSEPKYYEHRQRIYLALGRNDEADKDFFEAGRLRNAASGE